MPPLRNDIFVPPVSRNSARTGRCHGSADRLVRCGAYRRTCARAHTQAGTAKTAESLASAPIRLAPRARQGGAAFLAARPVGERGDVPFGWARRLALKLSHMGFRMGRRRPQNSTGP